MDPEFMKNIKNHTLIPLIKDRMASLVQFQTDLFVLKNIS